jgi:hypoxanthine phosphoribosyltransferase
MARARFGRPSSDARRRAIPAKKKKSTRRPGSRRKVAARARAAKAPARKARRGKPARAARTAAPRTRRPAAVREQPLGAGVGDSFAVRRLKIPPQQSRARPQSRVREISWIQFGDITRELAEQMAREFSPEVILGVVNGGVFIGGALAPPFGAEFIPVKFDKHTRRAPAERLPSLAGKRVLAVDDVTVSGQTLSRARALAEKAGAADVRTCALVCRPDGSHPDYFALETDEIVVFGWDYQLHADAGSEPGDPGDVGV